MAANTQLKERFWACVKDGKVEQAIVWDGVQEWPPAEQYTMVELPDGSPVGIGWDYVDGEFVDNRPQVDEEL